MPTVKMFIVSGRYRNPEMRKRSSRTGCAMFSRHRAQSLLLAQAAQENRWMIPELVAEYTAPTYGGCPVSTLLAAHLA